MREHPSPRIIHQGRAPGGRCCALGAPLGILLIAFAFYLLGLPASFVHNDEAHGAVVWIYDLPGTLAAVARDSHPPLYYLVLWGWLRLVPHPFALKFVSPFFALLALALTYRLVAEAAGRRAAAGAVLLMAFNPLFFALATLGRMYPMAIAAAALGFRQALRRRDGSWLLSAWVLTLTHFYGLLFLPAQRLLIPGWRPRLRELGRMALALLPIAGWSLWALGPSMAHTVRTLSRIPVRPTPLEVLANLMGALGIGIGADG
ncbi:glycosyltransferase family 39 protein, partial [Thermoflexus sp.]|uniref:glycosyltransferase family 39 protein n=1 Tax=Thermoflexus sp. TaxID=1969742 RepID=UPI003BFB004B